MTLKIHQNLAREIIEAGKHGLAKKGFMCYKNDWVL